MSRARILADYVNAGDELALKAPLASPAFTGGMTVDGATVFNEASADVDFRVESNGNANMLVVDASADKVGIGIAAPEKLVHIVGAADNATLEGIQIDNSDFESGQTGQAVAINMRLVRGDTSALRDAGRITVGKGKDWNNAVDCDGFMSFKTRLADTLTEHMRIAADGNVCIGTSSPEARLHIKGSGNTTATKAFMCHSASGSVRFVIPDDSPFAVKLTVSDNGHVMNVNENGYSSGVHNIYYKTDGSVFTGYHYYAKKDTEETFEMGDAVVLEDGKATKCTTANATNVAGIISGHPMPGGRYLSNNKDEIATEEDDVEVASVGDSQDWNKVSTHYLTGFKVCNENGAISSGDLLCTASVAGYLMKQDGVSITTETVGKSMDDVTFDGNGKASGIYGYIYCG